MNRVPSGHTLALLATFLLCSKSEPVHSIFEMFSSMFLVVTTLEVTWRGGEWYLEKRGSRQILAGSRKLGSVFDKSRSLVFAWFVFTFFESRNFLPKSLGLGFLTRISASRILLFATPTWGLKEGSKVTHSSY